MSAAPGKRWQPFLNAIHPAGAANRVRGLGGKAEAWAALDPAADGRQSTDLVLLAPTFGQSLRPGWLKRALRISVEALSADGILYALVPWPWRGRVAKALARHGLETGTVIGHFDAPGSASYVQLSRAPLLYALENLPIPRARPYRYAAKALTGITGGTSLFAALLPKAGLPAFHRGREPPFARLLGRSAARTSLVVTTRWHSPDSEATIFLFPDSASLPATVAKIGKAGTDEASRLARLGHAAAMAGIGVPRVIERARDGDGAMIVETVVPGSPVAALLRRRPDRLEAVVDGLARRLAEWQRLTLTTAELTPQRREEEFLAPVRLLIDELPRGAAYLDWIARRSRELLGRPLPWVAAHNDLTMSNVLSDAQGGLGIVDWNGAQPDGLPLADFCYAACDALSVTREHGDRAAAFLDCFAASGSHRALISRHEELLRQDLPGAEDWIELCFHVGWLQHAMNERLRAASSQPRPFLAIARALAHGFDRGL